MGLMEWNGTIWGKKGHFILHQDILSCSCPAVTLAPFDKHLRRLHLGDSSKNGMSRSISKKQLRIVDPLEGVSSAVRPGFRTSAQGGLR
jgi:hypothetical protein